MPEKPNKQWPALSRCFMQQSYLTETVKNDFILNMTLETRSKTFANMSKSSLFSPTPKKPLNQRNTSRREKIKQIKKKSNLLITLPGVTDWVSVVYSCMTPVTISNHGWHSRQQILLIIKTEKNLYSINVLYYGGNESFSMCQSYDKSLFSRWN